MTNQDIIQEMQRLKNEAYGLFGLIPSASLAEVEAAYERIAYEWHPNRHPQDPEAFTRFKTLCHAREIIHGGSKAFEKQAMQNLMRQTPQEHENRSFESQTPINHVERTSPVNLNYPESIPYPPCPPYHPDGSYQNAEPTPSAPPEYDENWRQYNQQSNEKNYQSLRQETPCAPEQAEQINKLLYVLMLMLELLKRTLDLYLITQATQRNVIVMNNHYYREPTVMYEGSYCRMTFAI